MAKKFPLNHTLAREYQVLFETCRVVPKSLPIVRVYSTTLLRHRPRYEAVSLLAPGESLLAKIPWYFIGCLHMLESGFNFNGHLHNGDPLTHCTVRIPKNHPAAGNPPFSWEDSAVDALQLKGLHKWTDWSWPGMLYQFERYNGFGYRMRGLPSPYLWSFSRHYTGGKFIADGLFSPNAQSNQCGAGTLLSWMHKEGLLA